MARRFRLALFASLTFIGAAMILPMIPASTGLGPIGSAQAQMTQKAANDGGSIIDLTKESRMKKSRTEGPGMKALVHDAPKYCVDCHRGHDRHRARRPRSAKR